MTIPQDYSIRRLGEFIGHDFGTTAPRTVSQQDINGFAAITGDHQWIHVDVTRARAESPFGGPVAHGFLTLALLASDVLDSGIIPRDAKGAINYGLENIRFMAPVPAGATVTAGFKLAGVDDRGPKGQLLRINAVLKVEGSEKPAIVGDILALVMG